jgi:uncharacterized membrane protein
MTDPPGRHEHNVTMAHRMPERSSASAQAAAYRLGALLLGAGTTHFALPMPYDSIVPAELPGSARFYTYASGVAELATGALLLTPRTRRVGGLAAAVLFVSVFPANVNMVRLWWDRGWPMRVVAIARLPLQIPMVTQALKVWRSEAGFSRAASPSASGNETGLTVRPVRT